MKSEFIFSILVLCSILLPFIGVLFSFKKFNTLFSPFEHLNCTNESQFDEELSAIVSKSPINDIFRRHQIILFVTNAGMIKLARNAICSLTRTGVPKNRYVIVALDEISYVSLKNFDANVLYYPSNYSTDPVNYRNKAEFYRIVKVRPYIAQKILNLGADVIISDIDIVFLQDPILLFSNDADFEVQVDSKEDALIPKDRNPFFWSVNLGFYKVHSTPVVRRFFPIWLRKMNVMPDSHDQTVMWLIVRSQTIQKVFADTLSINISGLLSSNEDSVFRLRYIDPLLAVNAGGVFIYGSKLWRREARQRNISSPVLCHFFHISETEQKERMMKEKKLWYIDESDACMSTPPKGNKWPYWS